MSPFPNFSPGKNVTSSLFTKRKRDIRCSKWNPTKWEKAKRHRIDVISPPRLLFAHAFLFQNINGKGLQKPKGGFYNPFLSIFWKKRGLLVFNFFGNTTRPPLFYLLHLLSSVFVQNIDGKGLQNFLPLVAIAVRKELCRQGNGAIKDCQALLA